jgi:hypothetical protein
MMPYYFAVGKMALGCHGEWIRRAPHERTRNTQAKGAEQTTAAKA